jgi:hypothetical protein
MRTKFLSILTTASAMTGIAVTTGVAEAATITYTTAFNAPADATVPYAGFGYTDIVNAPLSIQKFDSSLGTLDRVTIDFIGDLKGDAGFENTSPVPSTITVGLAGELKLQLPEGTSVAEFSPQQSYSYDVTGYDGNRDFAGTSGKTVEGLTASQSETTTYTDSNLLESFTGDGDLDLLFSATAKSTVSGSGNITSYVTTYAKSSVNVTYEYKERKKVPEPSAMVGLGLVAGFVWLQKKRQEARVGHS